MSRFFPLLLLLAWLLPVTTLAQATPQRIVSMNVCTDQLLLLLVERSRIASLSRFAADPAWSSLADIATGIASNSGQADEVVALTPDLVLTSAFSGTFAASVLQRVQLRVERLGFAASRDDVVAQIAQVAAWTGTDERAQLLTDTMQRQIDSRISQLLPVLAGHSAVFLNGNGVAYGSSTLQHDFLQSLGLRNIAAEAGIDGPGQLSLELLLQAAPDYLISEPRGALDRQLAHPYLQHAALRRLSARRLTLPERWFDCAGPWLADAYDSLAQQLDTPR